MTRECGQNGECEAKDARTQMLEGAGVVKDRSVRSVADATHPFRKGALGMGLLAFVFVVLLACALWAVSGMYAHAAHEQGAVTLRESILQAADQCYAIEGAYPVSLGYLERRYGLSVNRDGYDVTYEAFASNIAPTVVVKAL